jgi:hypothetical protein
MSAADCNESLSELVSDVASAKQVLADADGYS